MKAARLHEYDAKIGTHPLRVEEVEDPKIEGPFDVIVRIGAAGLCRTDLHIIEGQWQPIQDPDHTLLPYIPGHENAGWVEEVGSAVTNVRPGDTVIVHPLITCGLCRACRAGDDMHCENASFPGLSRDGGFAEYLKTSARSVVKLDPGLHPRDIAALADAGLTAYHAVKKAAPLLYPGARCVVIGSGGLGHIGIQTLKALTPAEVIVVDPSEKALELARELGADQTVKVEGGYVERVLEMTGGGAEVVMDFVGEKGAQADAWRMTRPRGSHFVVGYGGKVEVPTIDIISTERNIVGNLVGTYNDLAELMTLTAQGKVRLHTRTYPLEEINAAIADLNEGRLQGRGIIVPEGAAA
ncbi:Alcohol dehydrogenase GroES-like protein [Rubrobacter xylanophilus DSM 9941]|uniref:alcohol dehydrogenase n=1 Tax=Rubrobacter xylanophilus (strain DSM 9941 / JCM 11954 / NBRC 16129 / PRD-1) TaxID=266117 RepID=Q1AUM3_RUBXD|nr:NAD(P)-dependent alcohol dehydrogenase [Rubrobacter xylanophilus]ABG04905.1 Alcohol dehydrogenase GroES-like protein [Rubrobacter xylanophilus DSM 9941]